MTLLGSVRSDRGYCREKCLGVDKEGFRRRWKRSGNRPEGSAGVKVWDEAHSLTTAFGYPQQVCRMESAKAEAPVLALVREGQRTAAVNRPGEFGAARSNTFYAESGSQLGIRDIWPGRNQTKGAGYDETSGQEVYPPG